MGGFSEAGVVGLMVLRVSSVGVILVLLSPAQILAGERNFSGRARVINQVLLGSNEVTERVIGPRADGPTSTGNTP